MLQKSFAALVACLSLIACASSDVVPPGANVEFNPTTNAGFTHSWRRTVDGGCANFSSSDGYLAVRLIVEPAKCRGPIRADSNCDSECGPGLLYLNDNYIVVQNFWSWSGDEASGASDAGADAQLLGGCSSLTPRRVAALRRVAQGAGGEARTESERTTLARIDEILAASSNAPLESGQFGCMLRNPLSSS